MAELILTPQGHAALMILTGMCHDRGLRQLVIDLGNTTTDGNSTGDWRVTIERIG